MANLTRVAIIADDLTGAMDSAAPFAARGFSTRVIALDEGVEELQRTPALGEAEVLALNTESRNLSSGAAAKRVHALAARIPLASRIAIKKIDSTLRGHVVAETLALLEASGRRAALVAAAFPAQGRMVRGGVVHVHGVPLAETEYVRDALSPAPREPLAEVFGARQAALRVQNVTPGDSFSRAVDQKTVWIADADSDADLETYIRALRAELGDVLLVGSAGLTSALAEVCFSERRTMLISTISKRKGCALFLVGSRAQASAAQVAALASTPTTRVIQAPNGTVDAAELERTLALEDGCVVIQAVASPKCAQENAHTVAERLANAGLTAIRSGRVNAIMATGGDTAKGLLAATGNAIIELRGELMPGIPLAALKLNNEEYRLITKAGGFGQEDTLLSIYLKLCAT